MGGLCSDSMYEQIKEQNPQDFLKFLSMTQINKEIETRTNTVQNDVLAESQNIKQQNLNTVDHKHNDILNHFAHIKEDVNKSYPGGVSFLESSKQAKLEDILGLTTITQQFSDIKDHLRGQFSKQEQTVKDEIHSVKEEETKKIKEQTPRLAIFDELNPQGKDNVYYGGLKEYKSQIETTKQQFFSGFGEKVNKNNFLEGFKNLLPIDRLDNLTEISKKQITQNAASFIGNPGEGRATLY